MASVAVLLVIGSIFLARDWPFTQSALTRSLEQDSESQVDIGSIQQTYFPHPGCVADNVVFYRDPSSPRLTIRRLTVIGSYFGLLHRYIPRAVAENAVLSVPAGGLKKLFAENYPQQQPTNTSVGEIDADGAQIVVASEQSETPLTFKFNQLKLLNVSKDSAVRFIAHLQMPEPPGDLHIQGKVGPFRRGDAAHTPLSGSYSFKNAKLEEFTGVGGVLSSEGKFDGNLQLINVNGTTNTPDFQLDVGVHPVPLQTKFHALVNGTNGDLQLEPVEASFGRTTIVTRGSIEGPTGDKERKEVALDMVSPSGRIQDLLRLFVHDDQPPMTGAITFRAHVVLPPGDQRFLKRVTLQGDFGIAGAQYTNPQTQQEVDVLSARARGQADKIEDDQDKANRDGGRALDRDLERVVSNVKGHVVLRNGIANFSHLSFDVPGASALVHGTYNLQSRAIDMHGVVHMQTTLSNATTGEKSFLLKIIQPFTSHKKDDGKGSDVAVHITGTYGNHSFAVEP